MSKEPPLFTRYKQRYKEFIESSGGVFVKADFSMSDERYEAFCLGYSAAEKDILALIQSREIRRVCYSPTDDKKVCPPKIVKNEQQNDFIPWHGGYCPVPGDTVVQVKFRDGDIDTNTSGGFYWKHEYDPGDIIGYKVVKE